MARIVSKLIINISVLAIASFPINSHRFHHDKHLAKWLSFCPRKFRCVQIEYNFGVHCVCVCICCR